MRKKKIKCIEKFTFPISDTKTWNGILKATTIIPAYFCKRGSSKLNFFQGKTKRHGLDLTLSFDILLQTRKEVTNFELIASTYIWVDIVIGTTMYEIVDKERGKIRQKEAGHDLFRKLLNFNRSDKIQECLCQNYYLLLYYLL